MRGGNEGFRFLIVGEGAERPWLERQMPEAEFTGVLTRQALSRAFANMDLFVFSSETDRFGLVVLEALASFVPAVVTASGGTGTQCRTNGPDLLPATSTSLLAFAERFLHDQKLAAAMGEADREYAEISWEQQIFEDVYRTYERCFLAPGEVAQGVFDATSEFGALQPAGLTGLSGCGHTFGSR